MDEIKQVNKKIVELMKTLPLPEFKEPMTEQRHEMVVGLAQMYANKGFRLYLEYTIQNQLQATLKAENMNDLFFQKGRILTLKELYNLAKKEFEHIQTLEKRIKK